MTPLSRPVKRHHSMRVETQVEGGVTSGMDETVYPRIGSSMVVTGADHVMNDRPFVPLVASAETGASIDPTTTAVDGSESSEAPTALTARTMNR